MNSTLKYPKLHCILSLLVSAIVPGLVAGAAVLEVFIFFSCLVFFFLNWKRLALDYYNTKFFIIFLIFYFFLILGSLLSEYVLNSIRNTLFYFRFGILILIIWYLLDHYKNFKYFAGDMRKLLQLAKENSSLRTMREEITLDTSGLLIRDDFIKSLTNFKTNEITYYSMYS